MKKGGAQGTFFILPGGRSRRKKSRNSRSGLPEDCWSEMEGRRRTILCPPSGGARGALMRRKRPRSKKGKGL